MTARPKGLAPAPPAVKAGMDRLIDLGSQGQLSEQHVKKFLADQQVASFWDTRARYAKAVSEPLFTIEWMDSMARMFKGHRIVEILSYRGVLVDPMTTRGLDWHGVEENPPKNAVASAGKVYPYGPSEAIETLKPDTVVMSRLRNKDDDYEVLESIRDCKLPLVILRDSNLSWGDNLWDNATVITDHRPNNFLEFAAVNQPLVKYTPEFPYYLYEVGKVFDWFQDVPNWVDGDVRTWLVLPKGTGLVVEGKVVAGPPDVAQYVYR